MQLLLARTVSTEGHAVRLTGQRGRRAQEWALGGMSGPLTPVPLLDGRYLRASLSLYLDPEDERGPLLKVRQASYQYQADEAGDQWIFRYDYLRDRRGDPHPTAHLQIRGSLAEPHVLGTGHPLDRVHFPTGRVAIEAVIRLLVEQFGVPTATEANVWRPLLTASERAFLDVAHRPESGPPT
jgi:hypothetical protein